MASAQTRSGVRGRPPPKRWVFTCRGMQISMTSHTASGRRQSSGIGVGSMIRPPATFSYSYRSYSRPGVIRIGSKYWPPALVEWSTKAVRDAFYSSPQLSRLLNPDSIKRTISDGVTQGQLGCASKDAAGRLKLEKFKDSLSDAEVEISDDVFLLKADEAQKLLEPPRLAGLAIRPDHVVLKPGEQAAFAFSALDQYGHPFGAPAVNWSASSGSITPEGVYTAGPTGGLHTVRATAGGLEAIAEVRVRIDQQRDEGDDDKIVEESGKRVLRWRGTVPPQKWMNFYTKVLTRFVSSPDLKLEVSFEVLLDRDQAQSKADETRSGLKELGLDDTTLLS
jgi:hypothetical protein